MKIDIQYYLNKVCPYCINYNTDKCKRLFYEEIQVKDKYQREIITINCKDYKKNENLEFKPNGEKCKMPVQNFNKNYREV